VAGGRVTFAAAPGSELLLPVAGNWVSADRMAQVLAERKTTRLTLPGMLSREQLAKIRAIRDANYFLVRNRGGMTGERYRCTEAQGHNCGGYHEFFTLMGVDQPFRGLENALWGYATLGKDRGLASKLLSWAPHLGRGHPFTAHAWQPRDPGTELIAVAVGTLEPISQRRAESLARLINSRRPKRPFVL
jgi:hypothetical protein